MYNLEKFKGKIIAIIGLGKTGLSAINLFNQYKIDYIVYDDNFNEDFLQKNNLIDKFVDWGDKKWQVIDYLFVSPSIQLYGEKAHPIVNWAVENKIDIISDIEIFLENLVHPAIAITGTDGKSTCSALITHILNKLEINTKLVGNYGEPVLNYDPQTNQYVIEVSSFQLDLLKKAEFFAAILLNISADHLDRHLNMQNYINAKEKIFSLDKSAKKIISIDDEYSNAIYQKYQQEHNCYALSIKKELASNGFYLLDNKLVIKDNGQIINHKLKAEILKQLNFTHKQNILAAIACLYLKNYQPELIIKQILDFKPLEFRNQVIFHNEQLTIINDSKATNEHAALAALETRQNIFWLAGGIDKGNNYIKLKEIAKKNIIKGYFFGQAKNLLKANFQDIIEVNIFEDLEQAVKQVMTDAKLYKEAVIILAPACSSFDQFANYIERGQIFNRLVEQFNNVSK